MRLILFLQKHKFTRMIIDKLGRPRAKFLTSLFVSNLISKSMIIDIGSGTCNIADLLAQKGYKVTAIDVVDLSFSSTISPIIYDGKRLPFQYESFDTAILITVLHHTKDPKAILAEASRVSKQIVVIEDIYNKKLHKYLTFFVDSLLNLEFKDHPHSNKTDEQWRQLFKKMNLELISISYAKSYLIMRHCVYILKV